VTYLLDTVVVSEWAKPAPDPNAISWLATHDESAMHLSVATIAELRQGIALMPAGRNRDRLDRWLNVDLTDRFSDRILEVDLRTADMWGVLAAQTRLSGLTVGPMDLFVAATAIVHSLTVVTRNIRDFAGIDLQLINPWEPMQP
jgi:predicted nucleic acid-binding protein